MLYNLNIGCAISMLCIPSPSENDQVRLFALFGDLKTYCDVRNPNWRASEMLFSHVYGSSRERYIYITYYTSKSGIWLVISRVA